MTVVVEDELVLTLDDRQMQLEIGSFCRRWKIRELSIFGSVAREESGPESDVDVLVSFAPDAAWSYWDLVDARLELRDIFGRDVDLVEERSLSNPFRRRTILRDKKVLYAQ
jgi:predicted nucleotidyltransferase